MCGVAGLFQHSGAAIDAALLRRMTGALSHRGPDGDGFHVEPGVGLGHRRLAIVDVGGGQQPMYNEDKSVVIVFNGEIYNHVALRAVLRGKGHVFRNHCDTEAIVHAWEEWGVECLHHLEGMFVFALWDRNREMLFLARDRLGKKPLHYLRGDDGCLAFASELGALAGVPGHSHRIDPAAVDDFFTYGYIPDPRSIYQGVRKLPAGHYLVVRRDGADAVPQRYWTAAAAPGPVAEVQAASELLAHLRRSVADRLMADVPLGAFLSGGVDSGAVVALMAERGGAPVSTFTIGFETAQDERPLALEVARRYGTDHHAQAADFDYIDAARGQAAIFGEPFGDSSSVPTMAVCVLARRHVTVALSGDGGDEVLGGYRRYQWHVLAEAVRSYVPGPVRRRVIGQMARAYPKLDRAPRWLRAKHTLTEISLDSALGYFRTVCKVQHERRRALFSAGLETSLDGYDPSLIVTSLMDGYDDTDPLRQAQYVDLNTYLPGDILTKVDRTSMACSLEVRRHCWIIVSWIGGWGFRGAEAAGKPRQVRAEARDGAISAARDPLPRQAGLRDPAGRAVRARRGSLAGAAAGRRHAGQRAVPSRGAGAVDRRA